MSHSGKPISQLGLETLGDRFRDSINFAVDKPDFRELDLGSPVSPLRPRRSAPAATSSSSSSSGSVSGRIRRSDPGTNGHSGELSGSSESSPTAGSDPARSFKQGHARSESASTHLSSSATSPAAPSLPTGNICPSGKILKTGMATSRSSRTDVLGSGMGHYGHGSIMRGGGDPAAGGTSLRASAGIGSVSGGDAVKRAMLSVDPEEVKRVGNEQYKRGHFVEALSLYDRAIALSPTNASYRSNRAAALTGLGRLAEAVRECEEAVRLDPNYWRAHQRLASLLIRLGQVENARKHLHFPGQQPDPSELQKLQAVEKRFTKCFDARRIGDWKSALRECDAAIVAGADSCLQLFMCRAEALLKLHQLEDAEAILASAPKVEPSVSSCLQTRFFGVLAEAYPFFVRSQVEMALGRFQNAVTAAEKAGQIDPRNAEVSALLTNVRLVARARSRGNDLFKSERFTEACSAYGEGLKVDPSNSVLYCNRAACWYKLGLWERSVDDCNQALRFQPNYTKALLRRAASNNKMEKWADAVRDYEILRRALPNDNEVAESLFHAQVALKKSRGEEVHNMKFGGDAGRAQVLNLDPPHSRLALYKATSFLINSTILLQQRRRSSSMATFGAAAAGNVNPNKSFEVAQPPSDSVSSLSFSPKANILVATSWDNQVRCWEISRNGTSLGSMPKASISHDQPVLCSAWKDDGTTVFSGGCDKQVKMWPLNGQPVTVAMHDAPVKDIAWIPEMNLLVSGSWDKTLRYWDLRQQNPVHTQQLPDRCYALSVRHPLMVVGTADRNLVVFNLQNPQAEFKRITSPLKYQTRCVAAFPDQQGFLVGSIEGRVGVHHLDDAQQSKNFTFKCHRDGNEIYSVNSLNFHPVHQTFATAGSDGAFNFWDKDSKQRLKAMSRCSHPIPSSAFNNDGSIYAYSVCYDWSKGAENHNPATAKTYIYLHVPQESEVKGKPRVGASGRR